jgi:uncharacterized protein (TIGR02145 family)
MKNFIKLTGLGFLILSSTLQSCKKEELPTLSTSSIINITATSASGGGNITSDGGALVIDRGICWGVNTDPTTSDFKTTDGNGIGQFTSNLTGLNAGSIYYVRAYAVNSIGTAYGADLSFTTLGQVPTAITLPACCISTSGATLNGAVNANYISTIITFEYGLTDSYGQTIIAIQSPVTGNIITNVSVNISGLTPGTNYHFRIKSVNSLGTTTGNDLTFATAPTIPTLITTSVSNITTNFATTGGNITSDGGSAVTVRGVCWAITTNPTTSNSKTSDGTGTGSFISNISELEAGTIYYLRAYATNSVGTAYGNELKTSTSIDDIELNMYKTVSIGSQLWMAENLKTTKYNDGVSIPHVISSSEWNNLPTHAYCWFNNDASAYKGTYGALYNWYAVNSGKLCPSGWHVPTDDEWTVLVTYVEGSAGKLKESGTSHWPSPNGEATNETGFTALPGGQRFIDGSFVNFGSTGAWWSSTEWSPSWAWYRGMGSINNFIDRSSYYKYLGESVRCVKDN